MSRAILGVIFAALTLAGCEKKVEVGEGGKPMPAGDAYAQSINSIEQDKKKLERLTPEGRMLDASLQSSECEAFLTTAKDGDQTVPLELASDAEESCLKTLHAAAFDVFNNELRAAWVSKILEARRSGKVETAISERAKRDAGLQRLARPQAEEIPKLPQEVPPLKAPVAPADDKKHRAI
jgi:hypothetical protein